MFFSGSGVIGFSQGLEEFPDDDKQDKDDGSGHDECRALRRFDGVLPEVSLEQAAYYDQKYSEQ